MFGGKYRDKIRVWRHVTPTMDNELFKALLIEAKEEGFTAVRIKRIYCKNGSSYCRRGKMYKHTRI